MAVAATATADDDDELDSIEILSSAYRPTSSINNAHRSHPTPNDKLLSAAPRSKHDLKAIRSVDDYEKVDGGSGYYFRGGGSSTGKAGSASGTTTSSTGGGNRTSRPRSELASSTLIPLPFYSNNNGALGPTSGEADAESTVKEPISADERKRKRITLAVGIVAGIIIIASILLVAVTLNMTSKIDALVKEQNDNLYAQLTSSSGDYGLAWRNSSAAQSFPVLQYAVASRTP